MESNTSIDSAYGIDAQQKEIPWNYVRSSNIRSWRYDPETKVLEINFAKDDSLYSYDDVPEEVANGFLTAGSAGRYFRNNILNRYKFYRG